MPKKSKMWQGFISTLDRKSTRLNSSHRCISYAVFCLKKNMADLGFLGPEVSCAHGVWLTQDDLELMNQTGTMLTTQPSSNLRLSSGIGQLTPLLARGL